MIKIKEKMIVLVIAILLLCGCGVKDKEIDENKDFQDIYNFITYCDKKYGVEYVIFTSSYQGGMSVRLDENGNVIHCER